MTRLTDDEVLSIVGREIAQARGHETDDLQGHRENALKYYMGAPRGDEIEGKATIQSLDVADMVHSILAQLTPMMKSTLVEFEPHSEQDQDAAQLESDMCQWMAEQSNCYTQFSAASHDALLMGSGWMKVWVQEDKQQWETKHTGLTDVTISEATKPSDPHESTEIIQQSTDDETGLHSITVRHVISQKVLKNEAIAPEYMMYSQGALSQDVQELRFIAEKKLVTRSDLLAQGVSQSIIDKLATVDQETQQTAALRQGTTSDDRSGEEPSTEVIDVYECYLMIDQDGDGEATLRRIVAGGYEASTLISNEEARFIPYCTGASLPMPHRLQGTSMYELMKDVQTGKTQILRQWINNLVTANQSRFGAIEGEINFDDILDGQVIRMRSEGALFPIPFTDVGPSCLQGLDYLDKVRLERGGAALDLQGGQMQVAGTSATAAVNEFGHKEKMSSYYCRNIVESIIRGTFLLIHQTLKHFYDEEITARLGGKWQSSTPSKWPRRRNVRIIGGMSSAERSQKVQALQMNMNYQTQAMQAGLDGILVTPDKIHECLTDWLRAADLQPVEQYYVDPSSPEAQQASQQKAQDAQAAAQKQEALEQKLIDQQQQLDKYKHDTQLAHDKWEAELDAEVEQMKVLGKAVSESELESLKQAGQGEADAT